MKTPVRSPVVDDVECRLAAKSGQRGPGHLDANYWNAPGRDELSRLPAMSTIGDI